MKIVELCTSKGWGGLEIYAWQASKWLKQHQYDCHVVTGSEMSVFIIGPVFTDISAL